MAIYLDRNGSPVPPLGMPARKKTSDRVSTADDTESDDTPSGHGVEGACYSGGPGVPYYQPVLMCTCGWTSGRCDNWEEAGGLFDEHLEENP